MLTTKVSIIKVLDEIFFGFNVDFISFLVIKTDFTLLSINGIMCSLQRKFELALEFL